MILIDMCTVGYGTSIQEDDYQLLQPRWIGRSFPPYSPPPAAFGCQASLRAKLQTHVACKRLTKAAKKESFYCVSNINPLGSGSKPPAFVALPAPFPQVLAEPGGLRLYAHH